VCLFVCDPPQVGAEKEKVNAENESAKVEAEKCAVIASEVSEKQASCERDLAAAEPLVQQAEAALDTLNKKDLGETKSLKKPPPGDLGCSSLQQPPALALEQLFVFQGLGERYILRHRPVLQYCWNIGEHWAPLQLCLIVGCLQALWHCCCKSIPHPYPCLACVPT
jgi:hypothetical protein